MIRLFIAESTPVFVAGLRLVLNPDQSRYLGAVMRRTAGDEISLFNGRDGEWTAHIAEVGKRAVIVELTQQTRPQPTAGGPVLAVALVKRAALEYIVEKATELGAARIQLLITRRCNADHTRLDRLQTIAREAAEQTERLDVPEILAPLKLDTWLAAPDVDTIIFGDENSTHEQGARQTRPLLAAASQLTGRAALLIGPEGGFDDSERTALRVLPNVQPVSLGPRILRADTAAIAALALYQAAAGDWRL
ncbi:16S rRNA (uracil(1498)-N(3))-methyltransferase [Asticcacaulis sp. EMRT-3]|uniref:16S rRNA (uracil(1498)-N(3))-methyltransferase n=1 Tax=Asticcacaulis sp. EMRT-3 TaxID=3040349 RepID=UPI0024AF0834|nr:16S rRNA (uracil(1498)-N(3))-methyltransferase [Asticcacaulis sp. EMRT-3]MDI7774722.1 16S rRNA (uracil(1498)-N(3))-methyltransferase [Asticcacaulis sp. EMRT-3]